MNFTISFDPLHLIGLLILGYCTSLIGNVIATIIVAIFTPSLDGQKFYIVGGLFAAAASMTPVKLFVAFVVASLSMYLCSTTGVALLWTVGITAAIGFAFTLLIGLTSKL